MCNVQCGWRNLTRNVRNKYCGRSIDPDLRSESYPRPAEGSHSLSPENPSPFAISTHAVTRTIPYSRRGVGRPWDGANKFSEPISLTLTLPSLGGVMDHHAWHVVVRRYGKRPMVFRLTRDGGLLARYILLGTSFASLPTATVNAEERRESAARCHA